MTPDEVLEATSDAYLSLIHPVRHDGAYSSEIVEFVRSGSNQLPDELVCQMIMGESWRERLLGVSSAMVRQPTTFVESLVQSLRDPRGISIVPACAALAVLAREGSYAMPKDFGEMFDRDVFDGEIGWAADKALHFAGMRTIDPPGSGPNFGQIFEDHCQLYLWILTDA